MGALAWGTYLNILTLWHLLLLLIFGVVNFLPTFIARARHHPNALAIFVLNVLVFALWLTYLFGTVMRWRVGTLLSENETSVFLLMAGLVWSSGKRWAAGAKPCK